MNEIFDIAKRHWIGITVTGIFLALAGYYAFRTPAISVELVQIDRETLEITVAGEGKTRVKQMYTVSAPIGGRLRRIMLSAGDPVEAGETTVAEIEPNPPTFYDVRTQAQMRARLQEAGAAEQLARANLAKARSELEFAESEFERAQNLEVGRTITRRDLQDYERRVRAARAELVVAEASVRVAEHQVEAARAALIGPESGTNTNAACCIELKSPVTGHVLQIPDKSERIVASGTRLLDVGDTTDLEIVVDLLSSQAVKVRPGNPVRITRWGGNTVLEGLVRRIEPAGYTEVSALGIEEQRVDVIIDLNAPVDAYAGLGHGFRVEAEIITQSVEDALTVPLSALFRQGDDWAVYAAGNGKAQLRLLQLGQRGQLSAQVTAGLESGEYVVDHPSDRLADGARIMSR